MSHQVINGTSAMQADDQTPSTGSRTTVDPKDISDSAVGQALSEARALQSRALSLEDTYIRYVTLANSGGILACLGIADAIAGKEGSGISPALSNIVGPITVFFAGLICCGVVTSLRGKLAWHHVDEEARRVNAILADRGHDVAVATKGYPPVMAKGLPYLNTAINILGIGAQVAFVMGGVWGLCHLRQLH